MDSNFVVTIPLFFGALIALVLGVGLVEYTVDKVRERALSFFTSALAVPLLSFAAFVLCLSFWRWIGGSR